MAIAALVFLAVVSYHLTRPNGPLLREVLQQNESGWLNKLRYLWYPLLVLTPLIFFGVYIAFADSG